MGSHVHDLEIKSILLHNNCIKEPEFSSIMKALADQEPEKKGRIPLVHFVYSENEMGLESAEQLGRILNREYPTNLKTLALNKLKIQPDVVALIGDRLLQSD